MVDNRVHPQLVDGGAPVQQQRMERPSSAATSVIRPPKDNEGGKLLALREVLQDAYEYQGVTAMFFFLLYFTYTIVFTGFSWSENMAYFNSEVINHLQAYGPSDFQQTYASNQLSVGAAYTFINGYMGQIISDAQALNLSTTQLKFNQYAEVHVARLVVDVEGSCSSSKLHCYHTDVDAGRFGYDASNPNVLPSGVWLPMTNVPRQAYGPGEFRYMTLYNRSEVNATYDDLTGRLTALAEDTAFIARYCLQLRLELIMQNDKEFEKNSTMYFSHFWLLKSTSYSKSLSSFTVQQSSVTLPMKASFTTSFWDRMRFVMLLIYLVATLYYMADEIDELRLSAHQYGTAARNEIIRLRATCHTADELQAALGDVEPAHYISKMVRLSLWRYFTSLWNIIDWLSTFLSMVWALGWVYIIGYSSTRKATFEGYMLSPDNLHGLLDFAEIYTFFLYMGILNVFLLGLRLYKYMRYHSGLRVYYNLFIATWRAIKDFGMWFIYVMLVLASTVIMVFQVSGGNDKFSIRADGINAMALVTFGVMDYDTFVNNMQGLGAWGPLVVALFWINTAILSTIALNIIIAIVGNAYTEAKDKEGPVEYTLVYIAWLRILFGIQYARRVWFQRWPLERFVQSWVDVVVTEMNLDETSVAHEFRYTKKYTWVTMRVARLYARWGLALLPETRTLLTYFLDASHSTLCCKSPWEDGEAVEESLTLVAATNKRHKPRLPIPKWSIDTGMSRGQFAAFIISLANSGSAGLLWTQAHAANIKEPALALGAPSQDELRECVGWTPEPHIPRSPLSCRMCISSCVMCCSSAHAEAMRARVDAQTGGVPHHPAVTFKGYKVLSAALDEELTELDAVQAQLAQERAAMRSRPGSRTASGKGAAAGGKGGKVDVDKAPSAVSWKLAVGDPEAGDVQDEEEEAAELARDKWAPAAGLYREAAAGGNADTHDLYVRNSSPVFLAGLAILRHAVQLGSGITDSLGQVLAFRPFLGLMSPDARWDQKLVAHHYAAWVWEVYAAEMYADEDWSESMDDIDLKIVDLRTQLEKLMNFKVTATAAGLLGQAGVLQSRPISRAASHTPQTWASLQPATSAPGSQQGRRNSANREVSMGSVS